MIEAIALATMTLALGMEPDIPEEVFWTSKFEAIDTARRKYDIPPLSAQERMRMMLGEIPREEGEYTLILRHGGYLEETDPNYKVSSPDRIPQYFLAVLRIKTKQNGSRYGELHRILTAEMGYTSLRLTTDNLVERFEMLLYLAYIGIR